MATPIAAANAYASLARLMDTAGGARKAGAAPEAVAGTASFGDLLKGALGDVVDAGHKSDAQTLLMAKGKANVMDVVTAVAETDVAVSTLVSVRDKVIAAYEDVMKMAI